MSPLVGLLVLVAWWLGREAKATEQHVVGGVMFAYEDQSFRLILDMR